MTTNEAQKLTVICEQCGERHPAELSHSSQFGGHDVYAVVCSDWLTDYYTDAAIIKGE